jgi:NADPH:quinone reductase
MVIQLAKLAGLTVIATASRQETRAWVTELGADHVISHRESLPEQVRGLGFAAVDLIFNADNIDRHWAAMAEIIRPQGRITGIASLTPTLDLKLLMAKSVTFAWELMFTRAMFKTDDMSEQHRLLTAVAAAVDEGRLRTTCKEHLGTIHAANLRRAHARLESGETIGKIVLEGFAERRTRSTRCNPTGAILTAQ